jgi:mono/diheme cytochrome c family protein
MKTKMITKTVLTLGLVVFLFSFAIPDGGWVIPEEYQTKENPMAGQGDPDGIGKELFNQHCKSCHGKTGLGDGSKADDLETELRELGSEEVLEDSDGVLFYKSFIGRDEMPNFEKKISDDDDKWAVINYIRNFSE